MARQRIYTVGFRLPGNVFSYIGFESRDSLRDAEIVLFQASIGNISCGRHYNGKPLLSEYMSDSFRDYNSHWRSELQSALQAGKLVIVYLVRPLEYYHYTGDTEFSGSGNSRVTTKRVAPFSAYQSLSWLDKISTKNTNRLKLNADAEFLAPYWDEFGGASACEAVISGEFQQVLLETADDGAIAGAQAKAFPGCLLFLPPIHFDEDKFIRDTEEAATPWTKEAIRFGKRLASALFNLQDAVRLQASGNTTP